MYFCPTTVSGCCLASEQNRTPFVQPTPQPDSVKPPDYITFLNSCFLQHSIFTRQLWRRLQDRPFFFYFDPYSIYRKPRQFFSSISFYRHTVVHLTPITADFVIQVQKKPWQFFQLFLYSGSQGAQCRATDLIIHHWLAAMAGGKRQRRTGGEEGKEKRWEEELSAQTRETENHPWLRRILMTKKKRIGRRIKGGRDALIPSPLHPENILIS